MARDVRGSWLAVTGALFLLLEGCGGRAAVTMDAATVDTNDAASLDAAPLDAATSDGASSDGAPPDHFDSSPGDPDASTTLTADAACRASIRTQCQRQAVCRNLDAASCEETNTRNCPDYYFSKGTNRTPANIQACLPALAALTCTDIAMSITPPCLLKGQGGPGASCLYGSQCQVGGCNNDQLTCGGCSPGTVVDRGASCGAAGVVCTTADYCHPITKMCSAKSSIVYADEGQACDFTAAPSIGCKGDLICARPTANATAGTCQRAPSVGEPCVDSGDTVVTGVCAAGLSCSPTGCRRADDCGGNGPCQAGTTCLPRPADAQAHCVPVVGAGAACHQVGSSQPETTCGPGLVCVVAASALDGVCVEPGAAGVACDGGHPCSYNLRCSADTDAGAAGQCQKPAMPSCDPIGSVGADGG